MLPSFLKTQSRFLTMTLALVMALSLTACSGSDEDLVVDQQDVMSSEREGITEGAALSEIYDESLSGATAGTQSDLVVNVGDRVFFGYDRYDLSSEARATLENQARWLAQYPTLNVTVEGHADERGTREYNLALGDRRANSVKNYLIALGVSPSRIQTISYGKERPAVPGSNATSWSQNRRSVTKIN